MSFCHEPSHPKVIDRIDEALKEIRAGNITSIAMVMIRKGNEGQPNSVIDCWFNGGNIYELLGSLEALKHDFIRSNIQLREDEA